MEKSIRISAIVLLLINGIGALWGGAGLIYDPSGEFMQMPLDFLKHSPFSNYLIPGIILLIFNGLLSLAVITLTVRRHRFYPLFTILQGTVLIVWLTVQIIMIRIFFGPLHLPFYLIGFALVSLGVILLKRAKTD